MELTISDERIRAAAKTCPQARQVLEVLFPEVFTPDKDQWVFIGTIVYWEGFKTDRYLVARTGPERAQLISVSNGNRWSDESLPIRTYEDRRQARIPKEFTVEAQI